MEKQDILMKFGLNLKESSIYLALVEHGPMLVSKIAAESGLHRPAVYESLPALLKRGLVTVSPKGKQQLYAAEPPGKLMGLVGELTKELEDILPDLEASYQLREKKPVVKFLEGKSAITFVLNDIVHSLKKGDSFYRLASAKDSLKNSKYLPSDYRKIRDEKKLQRVVITNENSMTGKKPRLDRMVKFVPKNYGLFDYDITEIMYGDKIAYIDYNTETVLIIENSILAEFQKKIFKLLYDKLPQTEW
jgi:sugar-specific transcriptional regulator TrmB